MQESQASRGPDSEFQKGRKYIISLLENKQFLRAGILYAETRNKNSQTEYEKGIMSGYENP